MASESKPFASLSSGLLARKGAARPAMRPQGFGQSVPGLEDLGWNDMGFEPPKPAAVPAPDAEHDAFGEEIDEHSRVHPTGLSPVHSPVHTQQAEIADRMGSDQMEHEVDEAEYEAGEADDVDETAELYEPEAALEPPPVLAQIAASPKPISAPSRAPRPRAAPGGKAKAAFTLRLDPQRHLKLRLACAVDGRSAQQIVTDALDHLLTAMPELEAMVAKAKRKG